MKRGRQNESGGLLWLFERCLDAEYTNAEEDKSYKRVRGGYELTRSGEELRIIETIRHLDGSIRISKCLECDHIKLKGKWFYYSYQDARCQHSKLHLQGYGYPILRSRLDGIFFAKLLFFLTTLLIYDKMI